MIMKPNFFVVPSNKLTFVKCKLIPGTYAMFDRGINIEIGPFVGYQIHYVHILELLDPTSSITSWLDYAQHHCVRFMVVDDHEEILFHGEICDVNRNNNTNIIAYTILQ